MIIPDYRNYRRLTLSHSAKGSTWEDHKYIKRIDGTYYYPDDYEGGRHLSDKDMDNLSQEVIIGNFGNGQVRMDLLGENYQQVQDKVNQILLGTSGSQKVSDPLSKNRKKEEKKTQASKGLNLDEVFSVYRKKKK